MILFFMSLKGTIAFFSLKTQQTYETLAYLHKWTPRPPGPKVEDRFVLGSISERFIKTPHSYLLHWLILSTSKW